MKFSLLALLILSSTAVLAKEVKDFNKVLIENVQKDIQNENVESFKSPTSRAPASVEVEHENANVQDEGKIEKNFRQLGAHKW